MNSKAIYNAKRREEHRAFLAALRSQGCWHCGDTHPDRIWIVDRETGESAGLNMREWSIGRDRRAEILDRSLVLCVTCARDYKASMEDAA